MRALFLLSVLFLVDCSAPEDDSEKAFNVLFIAIDDLRPELACYGGAQVKTPFIDKLASQGLVFKRAYCQVPTCGASRCSLMTGILPTKKRFKTFSAKVDEDSPGVKTLPQVFKEAGYTTVSNGKIFHHPSDTGKRSWSQTAWQPKPAKKSFDPATLKLKSKRGRGRGRIYEGPDVPDNAYADGMIAEKTIKDLRRLKAGDKPFFLACGFFKPHMPFYAPKKYWDLYERDKIVLAENLFRPKNAPKALRGSGEYKSYHPGEFKYGSDGWHKMMRHGYYACVSYTDKLVGDVLKELKNLGLEKNTIVVIWGDHGWHLGEHDFWGKHNTMHRALNIPLIFKVPGLGSGKSTEALVESVDIFPTLCSLAGLKTPETVQGKSFEVLLQEPKKAFRGFSYSRFKSGDAVVTKDFIYTSYGKEEMLYDLKKDPEENKNVAGEATYADVVEKMKNFLRARTSRALELKTAK